MTDCGIVIVTFNSQSEIGPCLEAALTSGARIVVVDNASADGTLAEMERAGAAERGVKIIANPVNRGFAAAVNQGFAVLDTPYVLLLNPDAVLQSSLESLRECCDLPASAGAGGRLVDTRGDPQTGFMVRQLPTPGTLILEALVLNRLFPGNRINRRYRGLGLDYSNRLEVEQPAGAFLMVRRDVWEELCGFDENYFPLWFEDVDFCRRAKDRGYRLFYTPRAVAKHTGGHSIPRIGLEMRRFYWYRSLLKYSSRHFSPLAFRSVSLAVVTGSIIRGVAESALSRSLKPMAAYGSVVRLASRCLFAGWRDERGIARPAK
ncbi:MAG TPA: glycosyltransferase family 2 protein [Verrucomicrobiae bacterium]|nr:glycosyltransferase family 2 protein [Verrucomicrobiae bacterium]